MTWLVLLKYALQLVAYLARQAERRDVEKAVLYELERIGSEKADAANRARDDVLSGRVQPDPNDPNKRD